MEMNLRGLSLLCFGQPNNCSTSNSVTDLYQLTNQKSCNNTDKSIGQSRLDIKHKATQNIPGTVVHTASWPMKLLVTKRSVQ